MMDIFKMISDGSKYIAWSHLGKTFDKYIERGQRRILSLSPKSGCNGQVEYRKAVPEISYA